jgi:hypothetical protein
MLEINMKEDDIPVPDEVLGLPDQVPNKETDSRLASAFDGRRLLTEGLREDEIRSYQRAIVDGCYDGNRPYNQQTLNAQGRAWECNLNWLGLEGIVDSSRIPYYALFSGVPTYANFKLKYGQGDPSQQAQWEQYIAEFFTCMLKRWKDFIWNLQASQFEMIYEGWGPLIFEDPADWRFRAIPARKVLVPAGSDSNLSDRLPWIIVLCSYRVHELYDKIRKESSARNRGWNVENVQKAILHGTKGYVGNSGETWRNQPWERWQEKYRNKELQASYTDCDVINCAQIFVKEYSGKISQFIFTENALFDKEEEHNESGFLFEDKNRFDHYHQCMSVAFQNTGRGKWHSVKGIGLKSFSAEEVSNRLNCRAVNNAFLGSSVVMQPGNESSKQKLQLMVNGHATFIPAGATFIQHRLSGDIEGVLAVSRWLQNNLAQKIGAFNQRSITRDDGRGEKATAAEVNNAAAKEGSLNSAQIDNYYLELDCLYEEVFRRALRSSDSEAKKFREDCYNAGVPEEALKNMEYVRANRLSGYGSPAMRQLAMQRSMALVPMMNPVGRNNWLNEAIAEAGGADKVLAWNPPMDVPTRDTWDATIENDSLEKGNEVPVISGQNNEIHLQIHLGFAEEKLAPLQQAIEMGDQVDEGTLQQAYEFASALGPHCEAHLANIRGDESRRSVIQAFEGQLKLLFSFHGKLRSAIRSAQAQAAQQAREAQAATALSVLDQAKLQSAQQKMQIEAAEAQQGMVIKQGKAVQQNNLKRDQAIQKNRRDTLKVASDIHLDRIKTAAEVEKKRKQTLNAPKANGSKKTK